MLNDAKNANQFYDQIIMLYKGQLEAWYISNRSVKLCFILILATVTTVLFGKVMFRNTYLMNIPSYPNELKEYF